MPLQLFVSNDNDVYCPRMSFAATGVMITVAALTLTVKNAAGVAYTGANALPLIHTGNGSFRVTIPSTASLLVTNSATTTIAGTATDASLGVHAYTTVIPTVIQARTS